MKSDYLKNPDEELLSWSFNEFDPEPRSNAWYLGFGILVAALSVSAIFTENYLFAVIIALVTLIIFLQNWRKPARMSIVISPQGIEIGNNFYSMSEIKHFWLVYQPPKVKMLYFAFNSPLTPNLGIPLEDVDPLQVRGILLDFVQENLDVEDEPLTDSVARLLRLQ